MIFLFIIIIVWLSLGVLARYLFDLDWERHFGETYLQHCKETGSTIHYWSGWVLLPLGGPVSLVLSVFELGD